MQICVGRIIVARGTASCARVIGLVCSWLVGRNGDMVLGGDGGRHIGPCEAAQRIIKQGVPPTTYIALAYPCIGNSQFEGQCTLRVFRPLRDINN